MHKSKWKLVDNRDNNGVVPQQRNGIDCGMFSIMNADFASKDLPFVYGQEHMDELRASVGVKIVQQSHEGSL